MAAKAFLKSAYGISYDYLLREDKRLASFDSTEFFSWDQESCPFIPSELAAQGFYSLKREAHCRCIFCSTEVVHWDMGSKDWGTVHSNTCPMLSDTALGHGNITEKICAVLRESDFSLLNLFPDAEGYEFPEYSSREDRCYSFAVCKHEEILKRKEMLADAGFFSEGISDHLVCYNCAYGVYDWTTQELDNPIETHHRLSPVCTDKQRLPYLCREGDTKLFENVWDYMPFMEYIMNLGISNEETRNIINNFFVRTGRLFATEKEVNFYCWLKLGKKFKWEQPHIPQGLENLSKSSCILLLPQVWGHGRDIDL